MKELTLKDVGETPKSALEARCSTQGGKRLAPFDPSYHSRPLRTAPLIPRAVTSHLYPRLGGKRTGDRGRFRWMGRELGHWA